MLKHRMWTKTIGLALATAAAALPAQASAQTGWNGRYVWEEDVGRRGGNDPRNSIAAFITYTLSIGPGNGATGCMLRGQGLQTNRQIQCTVTPRGNSAIVKFYKYGPDSMGLRDHRPGQALFTLARANGRLTTTLQGLSASNRNTPRSGVLFRRAG